MSSTEIRIWNRAEKREELEKVYGGRWVQRLYGNRLGQFLTDRVLSGHWVSKAYGLYESSSWSHAKIEPFIRGFSIPMEEFEAGPFHSFNDFFARKFKAGARQFAEEPGRMPAFAEARYFAFERAQKEDSFPVKGVRLSPSALLGGEDRAKDFEGGPLLIARLCPTDYHRFHFPDSGRILDHYAIPGALHSVNPLALRYRNEILSTNERQVTVLETTHFGKLAYVEVGALCVGKIVQSHPRTGGFERGDEKGYFLFGGSTVILLGQPGVWRPDADLLEQTRRGREVYIKLGNALALFSSFSANNK